MADSKLYDADIYLIGIGLFELRQLTLEALDVLREARQIFHLTSSHAELLRINSHTQDLAPLYWKPGKAWGIYKEIARHIVSHATRVRPTAFATQGNPLFFNDISWEIASLGKRNGLRVQALPGISSIDVLPIQLGFDMGDAGTQIFEATQLVMFGLQVNPFLSTLVLQVAEFGMPTVLYVRGGSPARFTPLVSHLCNFFPRDHVAILIRSTSASDDPSIVLCTQLKSLGQHAERMERGMTLYLPRVKMPNVKRRIVRTNPRS